VQLRLLTLAAGSIGAVTGFLLSIGFWAVQSWAEPLEPMMYLGGALLVVYGLLIWGWVAVSRKDAQEGSRETANTRNFKRLAALMFQVLVGVCALLVSSLWALDSVREQALLTFSDRGPSLFVPALQDPSARVVEQACNLLFDSGVLQNEEYLKAALVNRPGVASKCLSTARAKGQFGVEMIGNSLMTKWRKDVMNAGTSEAAFACERAAQFSVVSEVSQLGSGDSALLECSLAAGAGLVRQCCAEQLSARGDLAKILGADYSMTSEDAVSLFPMLVLQAFRPLSVSAVDQTVGKSLKMDTEDKRRWVLGLACTLMAQGHQRDVLRGLVPVLEGGTCNLPHEGRLVFSKTEPWAEICPEVPNIPADQAIEPALCGLFTRSMVISAVTTAKSLVKAATRAKFLQDSAAQMDDGGRGMAGASRASNPFNPANITVIDFARAGNEQSKGGPCKRSRMVYENRLEHMKSGKDLFKVETTFDCDSKWEEGYTVADLRRDRFKAIKSALRDKGMEAGDTSRLEKKYGAGAVKAARAKMKAIRDAKK